ncbi:MAG: cell division protein FtsA [Tannerellaceae bacterium]|nr:cell division protein FtsA [Tannerellaceae bacterium]
MAYSDFIAAIDLGSSHLVGMVGVKNESGGIAVIAHEVESSSSCIRRGCVYNVEETANKVKRLILKLENKLQGSKIGKIYVGLGGQSIRSIEHTVPKILGPEGVVTEEIINSLYKECQAYAPDMLDVLDIVSPAYYLDGKFEPNPVGIPCNRIEARYKLIVGRPSLQRYIKNSIAERAKIEIAGIVVSPLALADSVLTEDEKNLGCALIDFGAGVTSLAVYKNGQLVNLSVIPFGGNLITRDITSLNMVEAEAERIKRTYGSVVIEKDTTTNIQVSPTEGVGLRQIPLSELNMVVEARMQEILENVYVRLEETGLVENLGAGVVLSGGASALKNLADVIGKRLNTEVRFATLRKRVLERNDFITNNPEFLVALSLLIQGDKNCCIYVPPKVEQPEVKDEPVVVEPEPKPEPKPEKPKKAGIMNRIGGKFGGFVSGLFDDQEDN